MDYIVQSTLSTLTGLLVIGVWLGAGYFVAAVWVKPDKPKAKLKKVVGTAGGVLSLICLLIRMFLGWISLEFE